MRDRTQDEGRRTRDIGLRSAGTNSKLNCQPHGRLDAVSRACLADFLMRASINFARLL